MGMNRKLYPPEWDEIAQAIKQDVNWTCEGCGKVCRQPGEAISDFAQRANVPLPEVQAHPKRWELGVAHLDHVPGNCDRANLRAWCTSCHCRYDLGQMGRKQMLKREREGQLCIDDPASEGLQLSLLPGQVAPFGLPFQGDAPKEGRSVSPPEPDVLVRVVSPSVADSTEGELRRHSPKGQASGWLETRIGNKTRKHPSTSYYYCWDEVVAAGETRRQKVYVKVSKVAAVRRMLNERRSVEETLRVLQE